MLGAARGGMRAASPVLSPGWRSALTRGVCFRERYSLACLRPLNWASLLGAGSGEWPSSASQYHRVAQRSPSPCLASPGAQRCQALRVLRLRIPTAHSVTYAAMQYTRAVAVGLSGDGSLGAQQEGNTPGLQATQDTDGSLPHVHEHGYCLASPWPLAPLQCPRSAGQSTTVVIQ